MVSNPNFDFQTSTAENTEETPQKAPVYRSLLIIAGILIIVCQLTAMVIVANGQVEKAQQREALQKFKASYNATAPFVPTQKPDFLVVGNPESFERGFGAAAQ